MNVQSAARNLQWRIRGFESLTLTFEEKLALGQISEKQMKQILRALTAKAGLTDSEIVGAYATRKTKIANTLLDIHKDLGQATYRCGSNPHFVADVIDSDGKVVRYPRLK
jgi:hypothetical protein